MKDSVDRQAAIEALIQKLYEKPEEYWDNGLNRYDIEETINALQPAQPEIIRCNDCEHLRKWRSEESAKKFGQIYECARGVLNCPTPEDFCSKAKGERDADEEERRRYNG